MLCSRQQSVQTVRGLTSCSWRLKSVVWGLTSCSTPPPADVTLQHTYSQSLTTLSHDTPLAGRRKPRVQGCRAPSCQHGHSSVES